MGRNLGRSLLSVVAVAGLAMADEPKYIIDLPLFSSLAPCAASALSQNVQYLTQSDCPEPVGALQSCVCSKNGIMASIRTALSSSISYTCGGTASGDQSSATLLLSAYCNQASMPSFPTPSFSVGQYITELAAYSNLAPCAAIGISYAVQSMTYSLCPDQPALLASCVCSKNQNSLVASQIINSSVKSACSSHTEDIGSAQAVLAGYCGMAAGTTSFPEPQNPPGDMTYYITALPQYSSLAGCAKSALSYAMMSSLRSYCPTGPQAVASCACIKDAMPRFATSIIRSDVGYSCRSGSPDDIASAMAVYDFYCSAARKEVVATGVSESIAQVYPTAQSGGTGGSGGAAPSGSGARGGSGGPERDQPNRLSTPVIGGIIAASLLGVAAVCGFFAFVLIRKRKQRMNPERISLNSNPPMDQNGGAAAANNNASTAGGFASYNAGGKPELAGSEISRPPTAGPPPPASPSPSTVKHEWNAAGAAVSPMSAHPNTPELQGAGVYNPANGAVPPMPTRPELQGGYAPSPQQAYSPFPAPAYQSPPQQQQQPVYEMGAGAVVQPYGVAQGYQGQAPPVQQAQHSGYAQYGAPQQYQQYPAQPQAGHMGWNSGPVQPYHEMDGGWTGRGPPPGQAQ